jgi:MFS family permease
MISGAAGYAVAGLVIWMTASSTWLFVADGLTFLLAGLLVFGLGDLGGGVRRAGIWNGIGRSWAVSRARVHLLVAGGAAFFISMSFPALISLAYHLSPHSQDGPKTYTILEVMLATGIVIGSVFVGRMRNIGSMRTVAQGLAITGFLSIGIAVSPWIWLVALVLILASAGNPIYSVGNVTALMDISDTSNRGTIMSSRFAITQLALIAGAAAGGVVIQVIGAGATYGVLGAGLIGLAIVAELLPREPRETAAVVAATE